MPLLLLLLLFLPWEVDAGPLGASACPLFVAGDDDEDDDEDDGAHHRTHRRVIVATGTR